MRMFTQDTFQQALSFLVAQTSYIEPVVIRMKYPELNYAEFVPIDQTANQWAKSITFFSLDQTGRADWFSAGARDVPLADIMRQKHEQGIEMAAIGYRYNVEELQQAMALPGTNLPIERAAAARKAYETFCHDVTMYGDSRKNWLGLINSSLPTVATVTQTWAFQLTQTNGVQLILGDVNAALTGMWQTTLTVEMADTILLPLSSMGLLGSTQLPNTQSNLLSFIMANNIYTQQTGQQLTIRAVRGLDTAGASGNGRMIVYNKNPDILKLHRPMPHQFLDVWRTGPMVYDVPGIFRLAGLEIRRPGGVRYVDGVC